MKKHLFFICPTDYLETVINKVFRQENYFFTSLGNSIIFDAETMAEINGLIETKNITEITFVLSDNNVIVMDALRNRDFSNLTGLEGFYHEIVEHRELSEVLWQVSNLQHPVFSHYMNAKIKELQAKISSWMIDQISFNCKLYDVKRNTFTEMYSNLLYAKCFSLN